MRLPKDWQELCGVPYGALAEVQGPRQVEGVHRPPRPLAACGPDLAVLAVQHSFSFAKLNQERFLSASLRGGPEGMAI